MKKLTENITAIYSAQGETWLANLPEIIKELSQYWHLTAISPVDNMTFHYVAKALTQDNQPVVLKIGCDAKVICQEKQALEYFAGNGAIKLLDFYPQYHALLLQQAIPGNTLQTLQSHSVEQMVDAYVSVIKKLHAKPLNNTNNYPHIRDWLLAIDHVPEGKIPAELVKKVLELKNKLLSTISKEIFLHGDLHYDNILQQGDQWLAIDPKGIVGDAEFEVAAFNFVRDVELDKKNNIKQVFIERVELLAQKAGLNSQRIKDWVLVRLILMAAWQIEDKCDPSWAINLAKILLPGFQPTLE